jgi:hypothetical protein
MLIYIYIYQQLFRRQLYLDSSVPGSDQFQVFFTVDFPEIGTIESSGGNTKNMDD